MGIVGASMSRRGGIGVLEGRILVVLLCEFIYFLSLSSMIPILVGYGVEGAEV